MIRDIGALGGVASLVGVVVLWTLYLSQRRDLRRLLAWAEASSAWAEDPADLEEQAVERVNGSR